MNGHIQPTFISVEKLGQVIGLPASWLKMEGEARRLPHLVVNDKQFYNPEAVISSLLQRMRDATVEGGESPLPYDTKLEQALEKQPWQVLFQHLRHDYTRGIASRIKRCFGHANIHTVGDLCARTKSDIRKMNSMGDLCFQCVARAMSEANLSFARPVRKKADVTEESESASTE